MPSRAVVEAPSARRTRRAMSLVEVLVAAMIVAIVAGAAAASWSMAGRAAANKRATEIGATIAVQELERIKAMRYVYVTASPMSGGSPVPTVRWYDKYGNWLGAAAVTGHFRAESTITIVIDRDSTTNREDLKQVVVEVWDTNRTRRFESARTLLSFGGV